MATEQELKTAMMEIARLKQEVDELREDLATSEHLLHEATIGADEVNRELKELQAMVEQGEKG